MTTTRSTMPATDDLTQNSSLSNLTSLENDSETDEFGRRIARAARDDRLLASARNGQTRVFQWRTHGSTKSASDIRRRGGLGFQQRTGATAPPPLRVYEDNSPYNDIRRGGSAGSVSSGEQSDPPVNVPREWGRKARLGGGAGWMRRITSPTPEPEPEPEPEPNDDTVIAERDVSPDTALPSIEQTPPRKPLRSHSTPLTGDKWARKKWESDALERIRKLEAAEAAESESGDDAGEFSMGASLLASTPAAAPRRNTALDDIRKREMETLRDRALTTSRLSEMHKRSPELRKRAPSLVNDPTTGFERPSSEPPEPGLVIPKRGVGLRGSAAQTERRMSDGFDRPDLAAFEKSHTRTVSSTEHTSEANGTAPERPEHRREDSHDLLRRLARITSLSPSPRPRSQPSKSPPADIAPIPIKLENGSKDKVTKFDAKGKTADSVVKNEVKFSSEPQRAETKPLTAHSQKATLKEEAETKPLKTPRVTGAWVDTPGPQTQRRSGASAPEDTPSVGRRSRSPQKSQQPQKTSRTDTPAEKPEEGASKSSGLATRARALPGSVLAAIVGKSRDAQKSPPGAIKEEPAADTLDYGDSTIDSLADMLAPLSDDSDSDSRRKHNPNQDPEDDTLHGIPLPPPSDDEAEGKAGRPTTDSERLRRQEIRALHDMNAHLRATRSSIRDAKRGLRRFESRIAREGSTGSMPAAEEGKGANGVTTVTTAGKAGTAPLVVGRCDHRCQKITLGSLVWDSVTGMVCYREGVDGASGRLRFTVFGIVCAAFWTWYFTETVLCSYYCQPMYATSMEGYGVDPDAPRVPFVTLTVLARPFAFIWRPLLALTVFALKALVGLFFDVGPNESAGTRWVRAAEVMSRDERLRRAAAEAARSTARAFVESSGWEGLSMMDDEII